MILSDTLHSEISLYCSTFEAFIDLGIRVMKVWLNASGNLLDRNTSCTYLITSLPTIAQYLL